MNDASFPSFGLDLTLSEAVAFLNQLALSPPSVPNKAWLRQFIPHMLAHIPYHNIHMLIRDAAPPSPAQIKCDMMAGMGGHCGTINPFVGALLRVLGYEVHLVAGSMTRPDCHLALLCHLPEGLHYVDCGDGKPYFEPMPIMGIHHYSHPYRTIRTRSVGNYWHIENQIAPGEWKLNCRVDLCPRSFSFFASSLESFYTVPEHSIFLKEMRVVYFPQRSFRAIRHTQYWIQQDDQCMVQDLLSDVAWHQTIESYFSDLPIPILDAAQHLYPHIISSTT